MQEQIRNLAKDTLAKAKIVNGLKLVELTGVRLPDVVKCVAFSVREQSPEGTMFIGATRDPQNKPLLTVMVTEDLVKQGINASSIAREAAKAIKGGGGGQPGFAQAGGKDAEGLAKAADVMRNAIN